MQIVIAIPRYEQLQDFAGAEGALLRDVSGVPLLIRILATGIRAGGDSAVIVHREAVPSEVLRALRSSKILSGLRTLECVAAPHFEPASPTSWQRIAGFIENEFLWLPWNWVTNKHALAALRSIEARPMSWDLPMRLKRSAVVSFVRPRQALSVVSEGTAITVPGSVSTAERWLVAHSGKPLDGIYSRFNRLPAFWLRRFPPAVSPRETIWLRSRARCCFSCLACWTKWMECWRGFDFRILHSARGSKAQSITSRTYFSSWESRLGFTGSAAHRKCCLARPPWLVRSWQFS